jgi:hypothetical protein
MTIRNTTIRIVHSPKLTLSNINANIYPTDIRKKLLLPDDEFATAVLGPGLFTAAGDGGIRLAAADGFDTIGGNAVLAEVVGYHNRTVLAEGDVVLVGAALVAVTLDRHDTVGIVGEVLGDGLDLAEFVRLDGGGVESEVYGLENDIGAKRISAILEALFGEVVKATAFDGIFVNLGVDVDLTGVGAFPGAAGGSGLVVAATGSEYRERNGNDS